MGKIKKTAYNNGWWGYGATRIFIHYRKECKMELWGKVW